MQLAHLRPLFIATVFLPLVRGLWPGCTEEVRAQYANNWPAELDYGIYWWGRGDRLEKAPVRGKGSSDLYDPRRPTAIYFHGWAGFGGGTTSSCFRVGTHCDVCLERPQIMDAWFDRGWNVGMFYWDQVSDEPCARDSEQKIWGRSHLGLRWRSNDVQGPEGKGNMQYHTYLGNETSVADLCKNYVQQVLSPGAEVRFIGHSLGAQLAVACAASLQLAAHPIAPTRVALLEPAFTQKHFFRLFRCRSFTLNDDMGNEMEELTNARVVELVRAGVLVELYQTLTGFAKHMIDIPSSEAGRVMEHASIRVQYNPQWCSHQLGLNIGAFLVKDARSPVVCAHDASVAMYFLSMANSTGRCEVPSAACSTAELKQLMWASLRNGTDHPRHPIWVQSAGELTLDASDDVLQLRFEDDEVASGANDFLHLSPTQPPESSPTTPGASASLARTREAANNASLGILGMLALILVIVVACIVMALSLCSLSRPRRRRLSALSTLSRSSRETTITDDLAPDATE